MTTLTPTNSERGAAFILAIFSLMIVSALTAAMLASARTEQLISQNQARAAQARAAAEAGLNLGADRLVAYVKSWQANGFASASAAMTELLRGPDNQSGTTATDADNGSVEDAALAPLAACGTGCPGPATRVVLNATAGTSYEVRLMDEDDPSRQPVLSAADQTRILENGNAASDANTRLVVRAIGYAAGNTTATLELTVGPKAMPAIVTNNNLTVSGNMTVTGLYGGVHTNGNLTVSGSPAISDDATSSGTYTVTGNPTVAGEAGGEYPTMTIPPIHASDYRHLADFVLTSDGRITNLTSGEICAASSNTNACGYGWRFRGATEGWENVNPDGVIQGTYYVETDVTMTGNPGGPGTPIIITLIAVGNIKVAGSPDIRPNDPELLYVTDMDLLITGGLDQPTTIEGQILVREQLKITGTPTLAGQILVENAAALSNLVVGDNIISGNATIAYNGLVGHKTFAVSGWREVRTP